MPAFVVYLRFAVVHRRPRTISSCPPHCFHYKVRYGGVAVSVLRRPRTTPTSPTVEGKPTTRALKSKLDNAKGEATQ